MSLIGLCVLLFEEVIRRQWIMCLDLASLFYLLILDFTYCRTIEDPDVSIPICGCHIGVGRKDLQYLTVNYD